MRVTFASLVAGLLALGVTPVTFAASGFVVGSIEWIRIHDPVISGASVGTPATFWITLNGVSSAGGCTKWAGRVTFVSQTKEVLAAALSAYHAGTEVAFAYNDTVLLNGLCLVEYVTLGNPPPQY
jgi:hypothetical protein